MTLRRIGLACALVALLALFGCGRPEAYKPVNPAAPTTTRAAQPKPNLLVIEADEMRVDELAWMPNTRKLLQKTGLTFKNSFAPYPLCCPSRSSFLTGKYPHHNHVYSHEDPFGFRVFDDSDTIATTLQGAGYRTALVGKYLNGYGEQALKKTGKSSLYYVPPGWSDWYGASDHEWSIWDDFTGGTYDYFNLVENINGKIAGFPGRYTTDVTAQQTRKLISKYGKSPKPWFIWWTPIAPHHGTPIEGDDPGPVRRDDGRDTDFVTPARPDRVKGLFDAKIKHGLGVRATGQTEADVSDKPRFLHVPPLNTAEKDALRTVSRQRAEALYVLDHQIGLTISSLSKQGLLDSTIIIFTSDNGYYLGEHRKRQGKTVLHEPSLRVPLIIAGASIPNGDRYDPVATVDLAPTLASFAGTQMHEADGMALNDLITHGDRGWTRAMITESMLPDERYSKTHHALGKQPLNSRGIRLGQWKLTRYSVRYEQELYDLASDPLELSSLHKSPAAAGTLAQLKALQKAYQDCKGADCLRPIPAKWQLTPAQVKKITDAQQEVTAKYYGQIRAK